MIYVNGKCFTFITLADGNMIVLDIQLRSDYYYDFIIMAVQHYSVELMKKQ